MLSYPAFTSFALLAEAGFGFAAV